MHPIWQRDLSLFDLNQLTQNGLIAHLGISFVEKGADFLVCEMEIKEPHLQPMGVCHGGAVAAMAETAGNGAGLCAVSAQELAVCLELNINHLRHVRLGALLRATARALHLGKRTQVWNVLIEEKGVGLTSASRMTLSILKKP